MKPAIGCGTSKADRDKKMPSVDIRKFKVCMRDKLKASDIAKKMTLEEAIASTTVKDYEPVVNTVSGEVPVTKHLKSLLDIFVE